jgi:hypothetical protein
MAKINATVTTASQRAEVLLFLAIAING